jgi:hypothetical protein
MTKNTKKLRIYEKSQFFDQKSLNWSILAKTLRIFLRFFLTMVQIKQGTIICCSYCQKLHIWVFVSNLPKNNDYF